jgi:hypothetical protein
MGAALSKRHWLFGRFLTATISNLSFEAGYSHFRLLGPVLQRGTYSNVEQDICDCGPCFFRGSGLC